MPLVPVRKLLAHAQQNKYALGYFESWNLESLLGVIDAAEQTSSPIIIGFSGDFLTLPDRLTQEKITIYGQLGRAAAENSAIPCGVIFNECPVEDGVYQAIASGFNLVMLAAHGYSYQEYLQKNTRIVEHAHQHGVAVEAELGELPSGESGTIDEQASFQTDPRQAGEFAQLTGVDLLSVSVGNVHVLMDGRQDLDLELLAKIHEQVPVPLGLHGGTGISDASIQSAARLGVAKVNYGTYLKLSYLETLRKALRSDETNPHKLLGMGGHEDILVTTRLAVRDAVLERLCTLGCCGRG